MLILIVTGRPDVMFIIPSSLGDDAGQVDHALTGEVLSAVIYVGF